MKKINLDIFCYILLFFIVAADKPLDKKPLNCYNDYIIYDIDNMKCFCK